MKKVMILFMVFAICGITRAELLSDNRGFEAGDLSDWNQWGSGGYPWQSWYDTTTVIDDGTAYEGDYYVQLTQSNPPPRTWAYNVIWQGQATTIPGDPCEKYRVSYWVRSTDADWVEVNFEASDGDWTNNKWQQKEQVSIVPDGTWQYVVADFNSPPGTAEVRAVVGAGYETPVFSVDIDAVSLVSIHAWGPNPAHESSIDPESISKLSWGTGELTQGTVTFDVWFDPNGECDLELIAENYSGNDVNLPEPLKDDEEYCWRVDTTDDKGTYTGRPWIFDTMNVPPTVDAGEWQYVWLSMDDGFDDDANNVTVQLNAGYTDDGKPGPIDPCDIRWEVTQTSGEWSTEDPNHILNPVIKLYDQVGYEITFTVPDGLETGTDSTWINVSENGCTAAYEKKDDEGAEFEWSPLEGDANNDCEVTIEDIVLIAFDWMSCNRLDCL